MGGLCPLYFDGAVCQFNELPKPDNKEELQKIYKYIESSKIKKPSVLMLMVSKLTKIFKNND